MSKNAGDLSALSQSVSLGNMSTALGFQATTVLASRANELLERIAAAVLATGYKSEQIHDSLEHLTEQADRTHDQQARQYDLQAKQIEAETRDRQLKDLLYNMEKLILEAASGPDPIVAVYGVRRLLELLSESGFSTTDLHEIEDKRLYDKLLAEAKQLAERLPSSAVAELEAFEDAVNEYGRYSRSLAVSVDQHVPLKALDIDLSQMVEQTRAEKRHIDEGGHPERPPEANGPLNAWRAQLLKQLEGKLVRLQSKVLAGWQNPNTWRAAFITALLVSTVLVVIMAVRWAMVGVWGGVVGFLLLLLVSSLPALGFFLGWRSTRRRIDDLRKVTKRKLHDEFGISTLRESRSLMKEWRAYTTGIDLWRSYRESMARIEQMRSRRKELLCQYKQNQAQWNELRLDTARRANAFIDKRPGMLRYVQRVPEV